jgi:hypothetical protein
LTAAELEDNLLIDVITDLVKPGMTTPAEELDEECFLKLKVCGHPG